MSGYRSSYRKTLVVALTTATIATLLGITLVIWLGSLLHQWLIMLLLAPPCFAVAAFTGTVAAGGLIGLRRDTLERRGQPYYSDQPRERSAGGIARLRRQFLAMLPGSPARLRLWPGEWVRVRSFAEISATLDSEGRLDGLPFMPEMLRYCGKRYRVFRRVDKIHDYFSSGGAHLRRMLDAVLLEELRCGGESHGGCQAGCQLIWKEAWLVPDNKVLSDSIPQLATSASCLEAFCQVTSPDGELRYNCQMTVLPHTTTRLAWSDPRHWLRDLWSGNARLGPIMTAVALKLFNTVQRRLGGAAVPHREPADGKPGPTDPLDLRPGEIVHVKTKREIEQTLIASKNRGLWFDVEMHRFCGGRFRVAARVRSIVDEASGRMLTLRNPCIVLEGVSATGEYLGMCPQNELIYWREAWLERTASTSETALAEES